VTLLLGLIPLALLGLTALLTVGGFELTTAVPLAGVVSTGMIGNAMFVRTPTDAPAKAPVAPAVSEYICSLRFSAVRCFCSLFSVFGLSSGFLALRIPRLSRFSHSLAL